MTELTEVTPEDILTRAKAILVEKGWTRGYLAVDQYGSPVDEYDAGACKFCTIGAIRRATYDLLAERGEDGRLYTNYNLYVIPSDNPMYTADGLVEDALSALAEYDEDGCLIGTTDIAAYNDEYAEDVTDIIDLLQEAIDHA